VVQRIDRRYCRDAVRHYRHDSRLAVVCHPMGGAVMTAYASDALAIVALSLFMASVFMLCVVLT